MFVRGLSPEFVNGLVWFVECGSVEEVVWFVVNWQLIREGVTFYVIGR